RIDLVPAYKISDASERLSAVDRSVLHTSFILSSLKENRTGDVLLLKQFLKANSLYGAEIKIAGLSGYLCELLIVKYGTFKKFVRAAAEWTSDDRPIFIDIKKYYKSKEVDGICKKFDSPFIVIDPTDKNRNVAAAVSEDNLVRLIYLCKNFVKKPSEEFFFRKPPSFEEQVAKASKGLPCFVVSMPRPDVVDDILWGQLHKLTGQLEAHLEDFSPKIMADDSKHLVRIALILKKDVLPKKMQITGPPLEMKQHVEQFKKTHPKSKFTIKTKKIYATVTRPVTDAEDAIIRFFHFYASSKSHLSFHEEMLVIERLPTSKKSK
ncbi:hypothetical protein HZC07_05320, partial [Candidatus Micrarchaeota archaeon]|nr:hypothetical protein [Candidatus Micrarchaeota archaeon]